MPDSSLLDLHHTEVPPSQRGKGLGGILAEVSRDCHMIIILSLIFSQAAFSYARNEGLKVILTTNISNVEH